ncbi:MAG: hypothetical protein E7160_03865 [Firmicutes bacterium]|nr:hypothetical protein [Bacillota bacterium]
MEGYKVFNKGLINRYGLKFEEKGIYTFNEKKDLKYGNNGYGFHFVKNLEDGLRYFDGINGEIDIAKVRALGNVLESFDEYYDYYGLCVTDKIYIDHVLTREEIIEYAVNLPSIRLERFVQGYRLNDDEIDLIINRVCDSDVNNAILYYQKNDKDVYSRKLIK